MVCAYNLNNALPGLSNLVTLYEKQGVLRIFSNSDPHGKIWKFNNYESITWYEYTFRQLI